MILTSEEVEIAERNAFTTGSTAEKLMDQAGAAMAVAIRRFFPEPGTCRVYFGKGNNAGDALVAARHLAAAGWEIVLRPAHFEQEVQQLPKKKLRELRVLPGVTPGTPQGDPAPSRRPFIVLDGLLGLGATGPLRESVRAAAAEINELRRSHAAHVFAVDFPTGLDADSGATDPDCVEADFTLAVGFAKKGHVADTATRAVGRLVMVPLRALTDRAGAVADRAEIATAETLAPLLARRSFDCHKTQFGRVGIVAGSPGFSGAAALAALGALRGGAGLVTIFARPDAYHAIAAVSPVEVMVRPTGAYTDPVIASQDVLAVGPGLGFERTDEVLDLLAHFPGPMVVDADALTILADHLQLIEKPPGPRLLTPHPGEMARLAHIEGGTRRGVAEWFVGGYPVTLLLKGARSLVAERKGRLSFNPTGNPALATGGVGDVLTGLCAALIGQGLRPFDAARVGAWVCGRAGEIAVFGQSHSQESLAASDLVSLFGQAFTDLRHGGL